MSQLDLKAPGPGTWELDATHFERPCSRFLADLYGPDFERGHREGSANYGIAIDTIQMRFVDRFAYSSVKPLGAPEGGGGPPPWFLFKLLTLLHPAMRRRLRAAETALAERRWHADLREWDEQTKPRLAREHAALVAVDVASLDTEGLIEHLAAIVERAKDAAYQHHRLACCSMIPVGDFLAQVGDWTGRDAPELLQLLHGASEISVDSAGDARRAHIGLRADPAGAALLDSDASAVEVVSGLAGLPGPGGDAYRAWVDDVGYRLVTGFDVCDRTLVEMPDLLLKTLRAAGEPAPAAPDLAPKTAAVRASVSEEQRASFDDLLAEARVVTRLRDERGAHNDAIAFGLARRGLVEVGRRLVDAGKLHDAEHAVELTEAEAIALLRGQSGPSADESGAAVAYRLTYSAADVPAILGEPPSDPPPFDWFPAAAGRTLRGLLTYVEAMHKEVEPDGDNVRGMAASPGVYEGTARIVLGPADFERVEQGDILIAPVTCPTYNILLPLLGGVVTDRGGLLCHAAIVAREYSIPSVVGCRNATQQIPDGAQVRIDGNSGRVEVMA